MLDLPEITVIVPVYNVENYLRECLDSLVNQTFTDIEIICVNDGSDDSSADILEEYKARDERITIISQENRGVSRARNVAMDYITGKYTYFMDSDDVLELDAFETLYGIAEEKSLDFVIFKIINFDSETGEKEPTKYYDMSYLKESVGENIFSHEDVDPHDVFRIAVTPASKFYRSVLISDLRFPEDLIFEDNVFYIESFFRARKVYFYDEYLSNKRVREGSITHSPDESFMDYIAISDKLVEIAKKYDLYDKYRGELYFKTISNIFFRFTQVGDDIKGEFFEKIRDDFSSKKEEYVSDEEFQNTPERIQKIFYEGIESQTYREYELSINVFDLEEEIEKQKNRYEERITNYRARIDRLKGDVSSKRKEIKSLKNDIAANKKEIRRLNAKIDSVTESYNSLRKINDDLMNSTSWKVTRPLRKVGEIVRK